MEDNALHPAPPSSPHRLEADSFSLGRLSLAEIEDLTPPQLREMLTRFIETENTRLSGERELVAELMLQLSSAPNFKEGLANLTLYLQNWSGCEAVGIRLRSGDDYPYCETRGFPPEFVRMENSLCVQESDGNPVQECMCGNVLSGRIDSSLPFFTEGGSFWSNNTTRLLASTTDAKLRACTRNCCNRGGYESVALIPLRTDREIMGLLQLNDRRPDRFSFELITHIERIADTLALAMAKRQTEEELRKNEEQFYRQGQRGSYRDITKQMGMEKEKERLEQKLYCLEKQKSLERMAGAIVHHFNNKLHVIQVYLQLSIDTLPIHNASRYNMAAALDAAEKASEVSKLMLTYLGQTKGKRQPLDMAGICRAHYGKLKNSLPKNVELEMDLPAAGPIVDTNENQIQQILTRLVANAYEATGGARGMIRLGVKVVSAAEVPTTHRFPCDWLPEESSYACLRVHDNGCGLSSEDLKNAFDPFYSTKFTGRGLGLPVVQGLVQAHKGVVTVESSLATGSTFSVFLPLSVEKVSDISDSVPARDRSARTTSEGKVLVVDDDEVVLEINSRLVAMLGYEVLRARDGVEGVDLFRKHRAEIRFVLSDFAMPRKNGLEMASALREMAPDIPVILASGYSEDLVMGGVSVDYPKYFLGKPFTLQELREVVMVALFPTDGFEDT